MNEEEVEVSETFPQKIVVWKLPAPNNQRSETRSIFKMQNKDNTLRLRVFHGTGKDDAKKNWFTYEEMCSIKIMVMDTEDQKLNHVLMVSFSL